MGDFGPVLIFPSRELIIRHNHRVVLETTGSFFPPDNLINPGSLDWVLNAIQHPIFGIDPYPGLISKAALLAWTIINDHIFYDGNKRTGMYVLETLLILQPHL